MLIQIVSFCVDVEAVNYVFMIIPIKMNEIRI